MTIEETNQLWTVDWYLQRGDIPAARYELGKILSPPSRVPVTPGDVGSSVVAIAASQVGVMETGHNSGAKIREYQSATWLPPGQWPWCAAFVCWVLKRASEQHQVRWKRPQTAGAWDLEKWAQTRSGGESAGVFFVMPAEIRPGDIIVYKFSHVGIAARVALDGSVETIEGNTDDGGSRDGDGVHRKRRKIKQIRSVIRAT